MFYIKERVLMLVSKLNKKGTHLEKRRINISSKRKITIPAKFYKALELEKEIECIFSNDMLILLPVKKEDSHFAEEILEELILQGYSGEKLLAEFKKVNRKIRPAVEELIEEADRIAESVSENYVDLTEDIFSDVEVGSK
jgi:bifunctional DNA-binding transcriptional regulator/antitoxin component of YhaV-PrlF toxin-antitoxin module